jgi:hypothetical protein
MSVMGQTACPVYHLMCAPLPPLLLLLLLLPLQMNYNNKNNLVGAMIVAGYDKHNGGQVSEP